MKHLCIHCPTKKEAREVFEKLKSLGYVWANGKELDVRKTQRSFCREKTVYFFYDEKRIIVWDTDSRLIGKECKLVTAVEYLSTKSIKKTKVTVNKTPYTKQVESIIETIDTFQKENHWKFSDAQYFWEFLYKELRAKF